MNSATGYFVILLIVPFATTYTKVDYYWRNYDGSVPEDAYVAGLDVSGKPIYIGQAFYNSGAVLPGTLRAASTNLDGTLGGKVFSTNKNILILCTKHPTYFKWVQVNSYNDVSTLTNIHLVVGGVEPTSTLYIAQAFHEGNTEIGKVYGLSPSYVHGIFPNRQKKETHYTSFMLLTYQLKL